MPDVFVRFIVKPPPRIRLKNEWWHIEYLHEGKNGKIGTLLAWCETDRRSIILLSERESVALNRVLNGFFVASGTPARGLVTELRRAGVVALTANFEDDSPFG